MLDIIDMEGYLSGDEEHVSGWDLVYDNGYIEIDPELCGYTTFLGSAVPVVSSSVSAAPANGALDKAKLEEEEYYESDYEEVETSVRASS